MPDFPRAEQFEPVDAESDTRWRKFGKPGSGTFPAFLGLQVEEVRRGYCRLRLPFKPDLLQAAGIMHGGAIATLLDSALVPAIGALLPPKSQYSTVDLHVQFIGAVTEGDAIAEGWVVRQGKRTIFGESEAFDTSGRLIAKAVTTFSVRLPG
jgi:uncharacterized protein (TIGR00369 family)